MFIDDKKIPRIIVRRQKIVYCLLWEIVLENPIRIFGSRIMLLHKLLT